MTHLNSKRGREGELPFRKIYGTGFFGSPRARARGKKVQEILSLFS